MPNMQDKGFLIHIGRNISPETDEDRFEGWVQTISPNTDLHATGATIHDVRTKLQLQIMHHLKTQDLTASLPPREWQETTIITLPEEMANRVFYG